MAGADWCGLFGGFDVTVTVLNCAVLGTGAGIVTGRFQIIIAGQGQRAVRGWRFAIRVRARVAEMFGEDFNFVLWLLFLIF